MSLSPENNAKKSRVITYIDGFNLYYGIRELNKPALKWLDIEKLVKLLLSDNTMELTKIKYFTAIVKKKEEGTRQRNYLKALQKRVSNLEIVKGKFISKKAVCRSCHESYECYEEKQTDVNIACHLLDDLYNNAFDTACIISADSDLLEPIKRIKKKEGKNITVWFPPKRQSHEIKQHVDKCFTIFESTLKKAILPDAVRIDENKTITRPKEWK